jgi:autotransporter-associated beta strand protein
MSQIDNLNSQTDNDISFGSCFIRSVRHGPFPDRSRILVKSPSGKTPIPKPHPMKPRYHSCPRILAISTAALFTASSSVHAVDYSYGTGSGTTPFSITATEQARQIGFSWNGSISGADFGAVYYRDVRSDRTFMRFDLSSLAGSAISGNVTLSLTADATYGGAINNGQISTANAAWSYGGGAPGISAISGATGPNASFNTDDIASWTIPGSALQGYVGSPSFHGLVVSADSGSSAHFKSLATLTGTTIGGQIVVLGATDWSAATFDSGSSTLNVTGSSDVSGGNVTIQSGATVAINGAATMGSGSFPGAINNNGALAMGSSASQTLSGVLSGTGSLAKSGAGTLTLSGNNPYSGGTTVSGGILTASYDTLGSGAVVIENGGTLRTSGQWVFGGANGWNASSRAVSSVTIHSGGTLQLSESDGFAIGITNLYLDGGSVTGGGGFLVEELGALFLYNGNEQITAGGSATSTISARLGVNGNNNTIMVDAGSTLNITSVVANCSSWDNNGGFIKQGDGTLNLSGINTYTGTTAIYGGSLVLANDAQLKFVVSDTHQNSVTGFGTATFSGDFVIDTSAVTGATGHIWQLVDMVNLDPASSFTSSFTVIGFTDPENDGIWIMTDAKGDWSFDEATGELTLDIGSDYGTWGSAYGLSAGSENDDLDNDGLTNQQEYAFGLIPNSGSSVNPYIAQLNKATGQFSYQRRDNGLTGLNYTIWYSTDLSTWNEDTGALQPEGTPDGNGVETINVTLSPALLTNPKLFVQVRAE